MRYRQKLIDFLDLQNMLKKQNATGCFPCCHYQLVEPQLSCEPERRASPKQKKEGKQSLKTSHGSSIDNPANRTKCSLSPQTKGNNPCFPQQHKKTDIQNQPNKGALIYVYHGVPFKGEVAKTLEECKQTEMRTMNDKAKQKDETPIKKLQKRSSKKLLNIAVQQPKKNETNRCSLLLGQFQQSVVSVNCENDLPPKYEQSQIMIDFFHPASSKKNELASYLNSQQ